MSSVKEYKESRNSVSAKYMEFNALKTEYPNRFFAFYEGKDAPYFYSKLKRHLGSIEISPIKCNGKTMVKRIFLSCQKKNALDDVYTGFFIDRDFDKNDEGYVVENFYVTDRYSIENYYTSETCLSRVLKNEMGINEASPDYDLIMKRYHSFQSAYHDCTSLFNVWYYTLKVNDYACKVSLDEKLPKGFLSYDFSEWTVSKNYDLEKLNSMYAEKSAVVTDFEIAANSPILVPDSLCRFRGKYELECLVSFMLKIQEELKSGEGELKRNPYGNQITSHQIISMWAQYTDEDTKLKDYVKRRIKL